MYSEYWLPLHIGPSFKRYRKRKNNDENEDDLNKSYGYLLPHPKTDIIDGENIIINDIEIGHSSMQGYRIHMEDAHTIEEITSIKNHTFIGVFDGHAGKGTADYASLCIVETLENTKEWKSYKDLDENERKSNKGIQLLCEAMVFTYLNLDYELINADFYDNSGSTAICAIITPTHIICANVGDSRCVLGKDDGTVVIMSEDHKPSLEEETERIVAAGGFVFMDRVNGELAMSRALGDFQYKSNDNLSLDKQQVIAYPDVSIHERIDDDKLLLLACDGIWDVLENHEAISYLNDIILKEKIEETSEKMAESLIRLALNANSTDNLSAIVVKLNSSKK